MQNKKIIMEGKVLKMTKIVSIPRMSEMIGKYGMMRETYLKNHCRELYLKMFMEGSLQKHLEETDKTAKEEIDRIVKSMAEAEGVTEQLKAENPLKWAGLMNNFKHSAEEIILEQFVYG